MNEILHAIENQIKTVFAADSSGHDIYHLKRVMNLALYIREKEGGDRLILAAAALVHDVHRIIQNQTGKFCSPKNSLPQVRAVLDKVDFPEAKKSDVLHCVEYHEEYNFSQAGKTVADIETLILQDADNLDAIGAIGIGRTFAFGGSHGVTMWAPEIPFDREFYDESESDPSVLHHFHSKLLKLQDNMNTETAKNMARRRHAFMQQFIREFIDEWHGKK